MKIKSKIRGGMRACI